jgi:glycosyltransferase involved in cell wall biosynthesis
MYLVPIIVPIFVDGPRRFVHSDWRRALLLLRDSLGSRYGELVIAAPWLPVQDRRAAEQSLEEVSAGDEIELLPVFDWRTRARDFWLHEVKRVRPLLAEAVSRASVIHVGMDDLHRPMMGIAACSAFRRNLPVILVQDTDVVTQIRQQPGATAMRRAESALYVVACERVGRRLVARADLSMLKGKQLMHRYGPYARNPREFHNTSYMLAEVTPEPQIAARIATLSSSRPLRLVYCGRLVARKGVEDSVRIVERARKMGADVVFDVIGTGPGEERLMQQIRDAGLTPWVRLLGGRPYGTALLRELASYDAMLFSPLSEDTPRMIFDGYSAGLPLLGVGIPYVQERADEDGTTIVLPRANLDSAAAQIAQLDRARERLIAPTQAALRAAKHHAADSWYQRRAQWTHEAVDKARDARRWPHAASGTPA